MKVEAEIWEMKDGKIVSVKLDDTILTAKEFINTPKKHTYKKKPKKDAYFSKTYGIYITEDEIKRVRNAINKVSYGYKPTFSSVANVSGVKKSRLSAIIDYLKKRENLRTEVDYNSDYIYFFDKN